MFPFMSHLHGKPEKIRVSGEFKISPGQVRPGAGRKALPEIGIPHPLREWFRRSLIAA